MTTINMNDPYTSTNYQFAKYFSITEQFFFGIKKNVVDRPGAAGDAYSVCNTLITTTM